jgi:hypothetical protein
VRETIPGHDRHGAVAAAACRKDPITARVCGARVQNCDVVAGRVGLAEPSGHYEILYSGPALGITVTYSGQAAGASRAGKPGGRAPGRHVFGAARLLSRDANPAAARPLAISKGDIYPKGLICVNGS